MRTVLRSDPKIFVGGALFVLLLTASLLLPAAAAGQTDGAAESEILVVGDTVQMAVEGRPELNLVLKIDQNGRVVVPQVGQISLAGVSVQDAGRILRQRLRIFDPELDSVQVSMVNEESVTIQIQGAVNSAGSYVFDSPPTLWDLMRQGGGVRDGADLAAARVVREESGTARIYPLELSSLIVGGKIPEFGFRSGDILVIPESESGIVTAVPGRGTTVFGAVSSPSVINLVSPQSLMDVLMLAGSPLENAELRKIWLVHTEDGRFDSKLVDLSLFLEQGDPSGNPLVFPGDFLKVSFQEDGWFRRNGSLLFGTVTAAATTWLAYDRITE